VRVKSVFGSRGLRIYPHARSVMSGSMDIRLVWGSMTGGGDDMRRLIFVLSVLILAGCGESVSVTGVWDGVITDPSGVAAPIRVEIELVQDGSSVSGMVYYEDLGVCCFIDDGHFDGEVLSFTVSTGGITVPVTARYSIPDYLSGTWGVMRWTAVRR